MTPEDIYTFDCHGLLTVHGVLSPAECGAAWAELGKALPADVPGQPRNLKLGPLSDWGDPLCLPAMAHQLTPILSYLLGPDYRLDHSYAIIQGPGAEGMPLHGGGTPYDPAQDYHWRSGKPYCGLVVVSIALDDIEQWDGGLAYIPGSHKSNVPLSEAWRTPEDCPLATGISQRAGSAIIFTEALTHGTFDWRGQIERRSLLYKFAPGHLAWYLKYPVGTRLGARGRPPGMATW